MYFHIGIAAASGGVLIGCELYSVEMRHELRQQEPAAGRDGALDSSRCCAGRRSVRNEALVNAKQSSMDTQCD